MSPDKGLLAAKRPMFTVRGLLFCSFFISLTDREFNLPPKSKPIHALPGRSVMYSCLFSALWRGSERCSLSGI